MEISTINIDKAVAYPYLNSGNIKDMGRKIIDLSGKVFSRLTVISYSHTNKYGGACWLCICVCGKNKIINYSSLIQGLSKSCGCLHKERISETLKTHGLTRTKEYRAWIFMKHRCYNENDKRYKDYGGRGINVCNRWIDSFENFLADMGQAPSPKHSIDRKENDGNYEPGNCRWATQKEQQNNKRNIIHVTYNKETLCLNSFCKKYKLKYTTIYSRLKRGWSIEKTLT